MELRRVVDTVVRSNTSPFVTTLRLSTRSRMNYRQVVNRSIRQITSSSSQNAAWTPITTSSSRPPKTDAEKSPKEESVDEIASGLWANRLRSPKAAPPSSARLDRERELKMNGGDSAADILESINRARPSSRTSTGAGGAFNFDRMLSPSGLDGVLSPLNSQIIPEAPPRPLLKLGPSLGRTIAVGKGTDINRGFTLLAMTCARNKVQMDFNRQRYHERPGMKRKRLASRRWRLKFSDGFKACVKRVTELKRQGW